MLFPRSPAALGLPGGVQRGCCRLRAAALSGGSRERPPEGQRQLDRGCSGASRAAISGAARREQERRGHGNGHGEPGAGASPLLLDVLPKKCRINRTPALPHLSPPPPELGEGLVPLPALRFPASVSMHPFPPKNFHRALKLSTFCLPEVLRTNPFAPLVLVLDQRGCGELVIIAARKSLR